MKQIHIASSPPAPTSRVVLKAISPNSNRKQPGIGLKKKRNAVILSSSSDESIDELPAPVSLNSVSTHASNKRYFSVFQDNEKSRKAKSAKLDVIDTISPVLFSSELPVNIPFQKPGHAISEHFVQVKHRIKSIVHCFEDIQTIDADDIVFIFDLREQAEKLGVWTNTTPEANLAKLITFCALEPLPDCYSPVNPLNSPLVNFLLLKRLHRRILATNEGSGRTGRVNYDGVARFACEVC